MDDSFERLEEEVNRLVEVLNRLRRENAELKGQLQALEQEREQTKVELARLRQIEGEHRQAAHSREEIRARIEGILEKLDGLEL